MSVVRLIHPFPVSIVVVTSGTLLLVAHGGNPGWSTMLHGLAVVIASQVAVGALNDFLDREEDACMQPDKPIPSGLVPAWAAVVLVATALCALIPLAWSFGTGPFILVIIGTAAGFAYDIWLKPTPASVLGYVGGFLALVTWVWAIAGVLTFAFLLVYPAGTVLLLTAHLANSFPDIESDLALGHRGIAALLGPKRTFSAILTSYGVVWVFGLAMTVVERRGAPIPFFAFSGILGLLMAILCANAPDSPTERRRLFKLAAPGIGILACGCLLGFGR